jgi:hypothetical protein
MFAFNNRFQSKHSILLYPGKKIGYAGSFFQKEENGHCELYFLNVLKDGKLTADGIDQLIQKIGEID